MRLYSTYKAYVSRTNKIILNIMAIIGAIIAFLTSADESLVLMPLAVLTTAYVAIAGVMDFFQFGGALSKKGNIPESILCTFKGKELLQKAVIADRFAHLIRLAVILLPTMILFGAKAADRAWLVIAAWFGAFLSLTLMQLIVRILCVTFQTSMLIAYLIMIPLSILLIIPSVTWMFSESVVTGFFIGSAIAYAVIGIALSVLHAVLAGSTYKYKLADNH